MLRFVRAAWVAKGVLIIVAWLGLSPAVRAQEALVLSGGAARGLAHGGVVVGLDRRGHDPEIVVGASMGAVIGSLYAAGYSAAAIDSIVRSQHWRELFTPLAIPVGSERDDRDPVLRLGSGGGSGLSARGYLSDWRVNRELVRLLFDPSARAGGDFDRLPRRFRAVAADLRTGERVVLDRGDLAHAVRASLSTPGFFPTVRWHGRFLVDGALRDYLPVDVARGMGASVVIASDVIHPDSSDSARAGAGFATDRGLNWLTVHATTSRSLANAVILSRIEKSPSPLVYPTDPSSLLEAGLDAALAASLPEPINAGVGEPEEPPASLSGLRLEDVDPATSGLIEKNLRGSSYDKDAILEMIDRLYATGLFEGVWVSVQDSSLLHVQADTRGHLSLLGALGYDNDRGGRAWGSFRHLTSLGSIPVDMALDGSVDGITKSASVSVRFVGASRGSPAITVGGNLSEETIRNYIPSDVDRAGGWIGADLRQIEPGLYSSLTFHAEHVKGANAGDTGYYGASLRLGMIPGFERPIGVPTDFALDFRFGEFDYIWTRLRASHVFSSRRSSIAPLLWGESVSHDAPLDLWPALGDEHLVPGLAWGDRRGQGIAVYGLDASQVVRLWTNLVLCGRGGKWYCGVS